MPFADRFKPVATAQAEFADRIGEQDAFDRSLQHYKSLLRALAEEEWCETDESLARTNVLTYYGIGGIGKTALLRKLADRLTSGSERPEHWPTPEPDDSPYVVCRLDASDFDPEDALLQLRASFVKLQCRLRAFDMCVARYWTSRYGQTGVADAFRSRSRLKKIGNTVGLGDAVQGAVEEAGAALLGSAVPGSAVFRSAASLGDRYLQARQAEATLRDCPGLEELLQDEATPALLPYYAYALAWDLKRVQVKNGARVVVLVDTFEEASEQCVQFFNVLMFLLPNVLFVVAGRNSLDWAHKSANLAFSGPHDWPGLVLGGDAEPRQHLVGYLSMEDRIRWLRGILKGRCMEPIIELAAQESCGLPVHLDLIAQHIVEVSKAREVTDSDVTGDLDAIAQRVCRDLSDVQRRALFASCLYRRFDVELVRVTADLPNAGPVHQLVRRPFVEHLTRGTYGFRLHSLLREAFRHSTSMGDDQWLFDDWKRAALRGAECLHERFKASEDPIDAREHAELLFGLVATFGIDFSWIQDVAVELTARSNWDPEWTTEPMSGFPKMSKWSTELTAGVDVVMKSQGRNRADVATDLSDILAGYERDERLDLVRYFLAQAQRDCGDEGSSKTTMQNLLHGPMAPQAARGLLHVLRREGDFVAATALHAKWADSIGYSDRALAEILWAQGNLAGASSLFRKGAQEARDRADGGELALCLASQAWSVALQGRFSESGRLVEETWAVLRKSYQSFADLMSSLAQALLMELSGARGPLDEVVDASKRFGQTSVTAYARFARCLVVVIADEAPDVKETALGQLAESVKGDSFAYLLAVAEQAAGRSSIASGWSDEVVIASWQDNISRLQEVVDRG